MRSYAQSRCVRTAGRPCLSKRFFLLSLCASFLFICEAAAAVFDANAYLVQSVCRDGTFDGLKHCDGAVPQSARMPMVWRRHDWPAPSGYQIEDSFADERRTPETIWSYPPFGPFNAQNGDGGEVYAVNRSGTIIITETQDGGRHGVLQHFIGPRCGGTGWLVAKGAPPTGVWASMVATLSISDDPNACLPLDKAFTRWRLETVSVPFIVSGTARTIPVSTLISEHYDGASLATAQHLERTFYGKGWGRVIWEAWGLTPPTVDLKERCPGTAWSLPPLSGWQLEDCRFSTNIVAAKPILTGAAFGWPAKALAGAR